MSDVLSFAELAGQHVELLPARTVLSGYGGGPSFDGAAYGGHGGEGGDGKGGIGLNVLNINLLGDQVNSAGNGFGGYGGDGGDAAGNLLSGK